LRFPTVDPSTAWVLVAAARRPAYDDDDRWSSDDADDVLYVGVVAQSMDATWLCLAGMYVFGNAEHDGSGRRRIAAIRKMLPSSANWRPSMDLPAYLAPSDDWFDERLHGAFKLPDRGLQETWRLQVLRRVNPGRGGLLLRLGSTQAAMHNVVLLNARSHVQALIDALSASGQHSLGDRLVSVRQGGREALRKLVAGAAPAIEPQPIAAPTRFPGGWVIVTSMSSGSAVIRLHTRTSLKSLPKEDRLWTAARASAQGVVDWSRTVEVSRRLASAGRATAFQP
jgi:hypothetical protein